MVTELDAFLPLQRSPWVMDGNMYVNVVDERDGLLFIDWEGEHVEMVQEAMGYRPTWAVQVDVSGRVDGTAEVRQLAVHLLAGGGVATDDYSDHCWTRQEIADSVVVEGLRFSDFRAYRELARDAEHETYVWPAGEGWRADASAWPEIIAALPIGACFTGTVIGRQPFGVFLSIDGVPGAAGLAEVTSMPGNRPMPPVGAKVTGEVIWHAEHNGQVKVRLAD